MNKEKKSVNDNSSSRKWLLTINNPDNYGFTHDKIIEVLEKQFKGLVYYCFSDEIGEQGTFHTHIFIACASGVRFSTLKKRFPVAHIDYPMGTSQECVDYVFKQGKWEKTEKESTNIKDSHVEWGELPIERQGKRHDLDDLYDMVYSGMSTNDIISIDTQFILQIDKIERARSLYLHNKYKSTRRNLTVTYIYGPTGTGKTRSVMDLYGYENVYRVTDYLHPFDTYDCEDVIIFEEFRSSLTLGNMLNYLDIYPIKLPARYAPKQACYTKVFIISNQSLEEQYSEIQRQHRNDYEAFLRRINYVEYVGAAYTHTYTLDQYFSGFAPCICTPFDIQNDVFINRSNLYK